MIQSIVNEVNEAEEHQYPCIMKNACTGVLVLFESPCCGTFISNCGTYVIGQYSTGWDMSSFIIFNGSVTLSNIE